MKEKLGRNSDFDVVRYAKLLVERHGEEAPVHAAAQANRLMSKGAYVGFQSWYRVVQATIELLRTEPGEGAAIN